MPDVVRVSSAFPKTCTGVAAKETAHLTKLIQKQKNAKRTKFPTKARSRKYAAIMKTVVVCICSFSIPQVAFFSSNRRRNEEKSLRATFFDFDVWAEISVIFVKIRQNLNFAPKFRSPIMAN